MNEIARATVTPSEIDPRALYSVKEAIQRIGVSRTTFHWLRVTGQVETVRWLRRGVRVKGAALLRFLARCESSKAGR